MCDFVFSCSDKGKNPFPIHSLSNLTTLEPMRAVPRRAIVSRKQDSAVVRPRRDADFMMASHAHDAEGPVRVRGVRKAQIARNSCFGVSAFFAGNNLTCHAFRVSSATKCAKKKHRLQLWFVFGFLPRLECTGWTLILVLSRFFPCEDWGGERVDKKPPINLCLSFPLLGQQNSPNGLVSMPDGFAIVTCSWVRLVHTHGL